MSNVYYERVKANSPTLLASEEQYATRVDNIILYNFSTTKKIGEQDLYKK